MNIKEAVEVACKEPTLLDALSWICVWESERAIEQSAQGSWETCFKHCLREVMDNYEEK